MKFLYSIIFILLITSCNNKPEVDAEPKNDSELQDNRITEKHIESLKYADYTLSDETVKVIKDWNSYQELNTHTEFLRKADFSFFMGEKKAIKSLMDSLETQLPKAVNTNAIQSRIAVLETSALILQNNLKLTNLDKKVTLLSIKEFLISFSNLNYQINKKVEYDGINIERPQD
jgi:hypothetical protein